MVCAPTVDESCELDKGDKFGSLFGVGVSVAVVTSNNSSSAYKFVVLVGIGVGRGSMYGLGVAGFKGYTSS